MDEVHAQEVIRGAAVSHEASQRLLDAEPVVSERQRIQGKREKRQKSEAHDERTAPCRRTENDAFDRSA